MAKSYALALLSNEIEESGDQEVAASTVNYFLQIKGGDVVTNLSADSILIAREAYNANPFPCKFDTNWDAHKFTNAIYENRILAEDELQSYAMEMNADYQTVDWENYRENIEEYEPRIWTSLFSPKTADFKLVITRPSVIKTCYALLGQSVSSVPVLSIFRITPSTLMGVVVTTLETWESVIKFRDGLQSPSALRSLSLSGIEDRKAHIVSCAICKKTEAYHICMCTMPPTPLCVQCTEEHEEADFFQAHIKLTKKAMPYITSRTYLSNYQTRLQGVKDAQRKLRDTKQEQVLQAKEQLTAHFDKIITAVEQCRDDTLQELEKLSKRFDEEVSIALAEVKEHVFENTYEPENRLATTIWNYGLQSVNFKCFTFVSDEYAVLQSMKQSVFMQSDLSGMDNRNHVVLAVPTKDKLMRWDSRFNILTTSITLSAPIQVDRHSVWADTGDGHLFVCGCQALLSAAVYLLNVNDGAVQYLPLMLCVRSSPGLIVHRQEACVFGGYLGENLTTCELYSFKNREWTRLPNLREPRSCFTPCRFEDRVFIAGGLGASHVEVFNWTARTTAQLSLEVPSAWSTCLVYNGELIVLQETQYYRWRLDTSTLEMKRTTTNRMDYHYSNCQILVCQEGAYVLSLWANAVVELRLPEVVVQDVYPCISR